MTYLKINFVKTTADDIKHLSQLPNLRTLHLVFSDFDSDALSQIDSLTQLEELQIKPLGRLDQLPAEALDNIAKLKNLKRLTINDIRSVDDRFLDVISKNIANGTYRRAKIGTGFALADRPGSKTATGPHDDSILDFWIGRGALNRPRDHESQACNG